MKISLLLTSLLAVALLALSSCRKVEEDPSCFHKDWVCKDCACTLQYDPVCGCNGVTYGNECEARNAGYEIKQQGECGK